MINVFLPVGVAIYFLLIILAQQILGGVIHLQVADMIQQLHIGCHCLLYQKNKPNILLLTIEIFNYIFKHRVHKHSTKFNRHLFLKML